jgi:phage shock protein E
VTLQKSMALVVLAGMISNALAADRTPDALDVVKRHLAEKKAVLLDVREQDEWDRGHLADAIHVPTSAITNGMTADELARVSGKETIIYLHCKAGRRAIDCAKILKSTGRDVRPLKTGYYGLLDAGFPQAR